MEAGLLDHHSSGNLIVYSGVHVELLHLILLEATQPANHLHSHLHSLCTVARF